MECRSLNRTCRLTSDAMALSSANVEQRSRVCMQQVEDLLQRAGAAHLTQLDQSSHEKMLRHLTNMYIAEQDMLVLKNTLDAYRHQLDSVNVTVGVDSRKAGDKRSLSEDDPEIVRKSPRFGVVSGDGRVGHADNDRPTESQIIENELMSWADLETALIKYASEMVNIRDKEYVKMLNASTFPDLVVTENPSVDYEQLLFKPYVTYIEQMAMSLRKNAGLDVAAVRRKLSTGRKTNDSLQTFDITTPSVWVKDFFDVFEHGYKISAEKSWPRNTEVVFPRPKLLANILYTEESVFLVDETTHRKNAVASKLKNYALDLPYHVANLFSLCGRVEFNPIQTDYALFEPTTFTDFQLFVDLSMAYDPEVDYPDFLQNQAKYITTPDCRAQLIKACNNMVRILLTSRHQDDLLCATHKGDVQVRRFKTCYVEDEKKSLGAEHVSIPDTILQVFQTLRIGNMLQFRRSLNTPVYTGASNIPFAANTVETASPVSKMLNFDRMAITETQRVYKQSGTTEEDFNMRMYRGSGKMKSVQTLYAAILQAAVVIKMTKSKTIPNFANVEPFVNRGMYINKLDHEGTPSRTISYASTLSICPGVLAYAILGLEETNVPLDMSAETYFVKKAKTEDRMPFQQITDVMNERDSGNIVTTKRMDRLLLMELAANYLDQIPTISETLMSRRAGRETDRLASIHKQDPVTGIDAPRYLSIKSMRWLVASNLVSIRTVSSSMVNILIHTLQTDTLSNPNNQLFNYFCNDPTYVKPNGALKLETPLHIEQGYHDPAMGMFNFFHLPCVYTVKKYSGILANQTKSQSDNLDVYAATNPYRNGPHCVSANIGNSSSVIPGSEVSSDTYHPTRK